MMAMNERYERDNDTEPEERPMGGTAELVGSGGPTGRDEAEQTDTAATGGREAAPLLPEASEERFRSSWERVQVGFVDEPRQSVQQADQLVAEVMRELAESFAQARSTLEAEWDRGEDVSTEDLRLALQRYRSFFQRLLAA
jgi:hypothetical protein